MRRLKGVRRARRAGKRLARPVLAHLVLVRLVLVRLVLALLVRAGPAVTVMAARAGVVVGVVAVVAGAGVKKVRRRRVAAVALARWMTTTSRCRACLS